MRESGVEGYVESAAMGLLAGRFAAAERRGAPLVAPPQVSALGALLAHVTGGHIEGAENSFQPMNVNFGLFPPIETPAVRGKERGRARKQALSRRALDAVDRWLAEESAAIAAE